MVRIRSKKKTLDPIVVDKFLGLNMPKSGDTQLKNGESGNMTNCYITKDYDLAKIEGYKQLMTSIADKNIQGMWHGNINGINCFLFACNGHVYRFNTGYWTDDTNWGEWSTNVVDLGTLTDAPTSFFSFGGNVYILNGTEYKKWTGIGNIEDVEGYIPKIRIVTKPSTGAGTSFESDNLLTGKKRLTYKADSTAVYQLPETNITSVDKVYVNGVLKTVTTHYAVNLITGVVTFTSGNFPTPVADEDEVEIYYTKGTGDRDTVLKNRYAFIYSQAVDSRVFLYGHTENQNQRIFSSLADGIASAEYFASGAIDPVGSPAFAITDIKQQQEAILTFTNQPATYISRYDVVNLDGLDVVSFPCSIINETRGNVAMGQVQLLYNDPFSIDTTLIKWYPTENKDERNMKEMGIRIQKDLNFYDLSKAITVDKQNKFEMWIAIDKKVWIYNYKLDVFSRLDLNDTPTCFLMVDGSLYFGTTTGQIMKFDDKYLTFNGTTISSHWEMNMYNFGADFLTKTLNKSWITLSAQSKTSIDVSFVTDVDVIPLTKTILRSIFAFDDVDFDNFTFNLNFNPKSYPINIKARKFTYLKLIIDNTSADTTFSVLNFTLKAEYGGQVK